MIPGRKANPQQEFDEQWVAAGIHARRQRQRLESQIEFHSLKIDNLRITKQDRF